MKKLIFPLLSSAFLIIACENTTQTGRVPDPGAQSGESQNGEATTSTREVPVNHVPDTVKRCYTYTQNRDTVALQVLQTGNTISGKMKYRLYEKDGNSGVISGTAIGDTLVVDYTFQAEGTVSTRQEILIKQGDGYVVAMGTQKMQGDKMVFTDRTKIKPGPIKLARIGCTE